MKQHFVFSGIYKRAPVIMIAAGLAIIMVGIVLDHDLVERIWSNLLLNTVYFNAIALCGVLFIALHTIADSGWQVSIQRIPEAMSMYLPVGALFMIVILVGLIFGFHHLYHWARPENPDALMEMKKIYLNIPFFTLRTLIYFSGWITFALLLRKISLKQDHNPDTGLLKRSRTVAALFIVFFAITSSTSAWDWLMSIDAHWFSTLYGWDIFSGLFVSGTAVIIIVTLLLRKAGFMPHVNDEHLHDLGKYLFGFSIFWAYLWFAQYMLIWYGNIPEETTYFVTRLDGYRELFFINLAINFALPFLVLMSRNSKRIPWIMGMVSVVVFAGHWIDFYLLIMPGTMGESAGIGWIEIGMTAGFSGLFLLVVFIALSGASLVPEKHPYYEESLDYHTQY